MPNIRQELPQRQREPQRDYRRRKPRVNVPRLAAILIIFVCLVVSGSVITYKLVSNSQGQAVSAKVEPTPEPTPTPTPKPTPSPVDESKRGDYPANLTKALVVNGAAAEKKVAYLTFDDGPSKNTPRILETLKKYNAKATFFVMGKSVEQYPELVKQEFEEGHSIGNHSYSHVYKDIYANKDSFFGEIRKTEELVGNIIGPENVMKLFRFPGGSYGDLRAPFRDYINEIGYKYVDWNALNSDADGRKFSAERGMSEIKKYCTDTGDVIILMHDAAAKTITADILPQIMDYLQQQGYTFEAIVP